MPFFIAAVMIGLIGVLSLGVVLGRMAIMKWGDRRPGGQGGGEARMGSGGSFIGRREALAIAESPNPPAWVSPRARGHLVFLQRMRTPAMIGVFMVSLVAWMVVFHVVVGAFPAIDEVSNGVRFGIGLLTWAVVGVIWVCFVRSYMVRLVRREHARRAGGDAGRD